MWIELALDYRCNLRCVGCRACEDTGESLSSRDVRALLENARARGIEQLWIGGGEPTLRDDLPRIVATARALGFARVLLQTNAMRLAYPAYLDALIAAGVTDLSVNAKSHRPEIHDALSRREGGHSLLVRALEGVRGRIRVAADVLLTRSSAGDLPETVRFFAARGVERFTLWLLSAADLEDPDTLSEVPRISELHGALTEASTTATQLGVQLDSLHTPPCTLPSPLRDRYLPAAKLQLEVVDPSGRSFRLEESPFEGGAYQPACQACSARPGCQGPRADYLRLHGDREIAAI